MASCSQQALPRPIPAPHLTARLRLVSSCDRTGGPVERSGPQRVEPWMPRCWDETRAVATAGLRDSATSEAWRSRLPPGWTPRPTVVVDAVPASARPWRARSGRAAAFAAPRGAHRSPAHRGREKIKKKKLKRRTRVCAPRPGEGRSEPNLPAPPALRKWPGTAGGRQRCEMLSKYPVSDNKVRA